MVKIVTLWKNGFGVILALPLLVALLATPHASWAEDVTGGENAAFYVGSTLLRDAVQLKTADVVYQGQVNDAGLMAGLGRAEYLRGDYPGLYYGWFSQGRRHGFGQYVGKELIYFGQWTEDVPQGSGLIFYGNGDVYSGPHLRFQPDGWDGGMLYADGRMYRGPWSKGKYSSWGTLVSADGRSVSAWRHNGVADNLARQEVSQGVAQAYAVAPRFYDLGTRPGEWEYFNFLNDRAKYLGETKLYLDALPAKPDKGGALAAAELSGLGSVLWQTRMDLRRSQIYLPNPQSLTVQRHTQWARYRNQVGLSADRVFAQWVLVASVGDAGPWEVTLLNLLNNPLVAEGMGKLVYVGE